MLQAEHGYVNELWNRRPKRNLGWLRRAAGSGWALDGRLQTERGLGEWSRRGPGGFGLRVLQAEHTHLKELVDRRPKWDLGQLRLRRSAGNG